MKRKVSIILACLLIAVMALGLCACGESGNGGGEKETTSQVETKAPVEKETTTPAETTAPVTPTDSDVKLPANPLVSDDTHLVISQDGILLSYEFEGEEIVGLIAYYDMGDEELAALMETLTEEEIVQIGQEDDMELLDIIPFGTYAGYVLGPTSWEGVTLADLKSAVELGVLTEAK